MTRSLLHRKSKNCSELVSHVRPSSWNGSNRSMWYNCININTSKVFKTQPNNGFYLNGI